jgi:hypothetical protein
VQWRVLRRKSRPDGAHYDAVMFDERIIAGARGRPDVSGMRQEPHKT